jgi:hypothetical protein
MLEMMKKMHGGHEHGHDFEAMETATSTAMTSRPWRACRPRTWGASWG